LENQIYPSAISSVLCIITQFTLAYLLNLGSVSSLLWRGRHAQQMRTLYFSFFLSLFPPFFFERGYTQG